MWKACNMISCILWSCKWKIDLFNEVSVKSIRAFLMGCVIYNFYRTTTTTKKNKRKRIEEKKKVKQKIIFNKYLCGK